MNSLTPKLHLVAWEMTRGCNLHCKHCRSNAEDINYDDEFSPDECFKVIDSILEVGKPILILTGGEPLLRPDVFQISKYAAQRGLRVVLGTNGTLITKEVATAMRQVPISRIGVSIDFPVAQLQDKFRGKAGAFQDAVNGIKEAQRAGVEVQINCTVTKMNVAYLDQLLKLAMEMGAVAFHPFMLVPTGRAKDLSDVELSPEEHERILNWFYDKQVELGNRIFLKPTDAPHYMRIMSRRGKERSHSSASHGGMNSITRGCLAGINFCFISHVGKVQGCGYLDVEGGNLRKQSFPDIWSDSALFRELRDLRHIKGKCGICEYKRICGGCRARAYEATADYLEGDPYCAYEPRSG